MAELQGQKGRTRVHRRLAQPRRTIQARAANQYGESAGAAAGDGVVRTSWKQLEAADWTTLGRARKGSYENIDRPGDSTKSG